MHLILADETVIVGVHVLEDCLEGVLVPLILAVLAVDLSHVGLELSMVQLSVGVDVVSGKLVVNLGIELCQSVPGVGHREFFYKRL